MSASEPDFSPYSVLVIDDQAFVRRVVGGVLKQLGFREVFEAEDGASGLKANNRHQPSVIICDIEMEPVDGLVFLQTLRRSSDAKNKNVPVVFLTQHAESDIVEQARNLGVNSFVIKPPSLATLRDRVAFALGLL